MTGTAAFDVERRLDIQVLHGSVVFEDLETEAREKLKDCGGAFMFAYGNAGVGSTYRANLQAFEKYGIIPRMPARPDKRSLETTIFGVTYSSPIFLAPIGVQTIFHADAEFNPARAGKALGVPLILSTLASRTIEEIAEANGDGHRWFQLYWWVSRCMLMPCYISKARPRTNDLTLSLLKRARENNFKALVVTLDAMSPAWRPHDIGASYSPYAHGIGIQIGKSDPVFMARYGRQPITDERPDFPYDPAKFDKGLLAGDPQIQEAISIATEWRKEVGSVLYREWKDLQFLRDNWDGPLVLKGIQNVHDAEKALDYGVTGIIVSNHGGRQLDGGISSLFALEMIMKSPKVKAAQQAGQLTVLLDSGVRTGSDIFKALALGAQAVLVGRPWLYASVIGGQAGVEQVLKRILCELDASLAMSGFTNLSEIQGEGYAVLANLT